MNTEQRERKYLENKMKNISPRRFGDSAGGATWRRDESNTRPGEKQQSAGSQEGREGGRED